MDLLQVGRSCQQLLQIGVGQAVGAPQLEAAQASQGPPLCQRGRRHITETPAAQTQLQPLQPDDNTQASYLICYQLNLGESAVCPFDSIKCQDMNLQCWAMPGFLYAQSIWVP